MPTKLVSLIVRHKNLIKYTTLTYIDKLIIFILPTFVLFLLKDRTLYNDIEYILSISSIAVTFLNFATIYSFYGYRQSKDRANYIFRIQGYFLIIELFYCIAGLLLYPVISGLLPKSVVKLLYCYICIHIVYQLIINFYSYCFRLQDKPSSIFLFSISSNVVSLLLIFISYKLNYNFYITAFFFPRLIIVILCLVLLSIHKIQYLILIELIDFIKKAIKYSIPLIINTFCTTFLQNYGKIYAYNFLSSYEMYQFSYSMRIILVLISLTHGSMLGYYGKSVYIEKGNKVNRKFFLIYSLAILAAVLGSLIALYVFNLLPQFEKITVDISIYLILIYSIIFCYSGFFEIYYNKYNKTIYILIFSLISFTVYLSLLFFIGVKSITSLCVFMVIYSIVNLSFILLKLRGILSCER